MSKTEGAMKREKNRFYFFKWLCGRDGKGKKNIENDDREGK